MSCRPAFGVGLVLYFCGVGFLLAYIWTRLYLSGALREGEVEGLVHEALEIRDAQAAEVMDVIDRQLSGKSAAVSLDELRSVLEKASPATRWVAWQAAHDLRTQTWNTDKAKMERTIPVFQALVDVGSKDERAHRYHAQLGFALKDKQVPDWSAAEQSLSNAIDLRGRRTGFELYEMNRAICRIVLRQPADRIREDLTVAAGKAYVYPRNDVVWLVAVIGTGFVIEDVLGLLP